MRKRLRTISCSADTCRILITDNGADPDVHCFTNQKAIDVVGQCRLDSSANSEVEDLLLQPRKGKKQV